MELDIIVKRSSQDLLGAKVVLLLMIIILSSCGSMKSIPEGQMILKRNTIDLVTTDTRINKKKILKELSDLIKQIPQNKNIANPRTYGKPFTIYDDDLSQESTEAFTKFLRNRKGFYQADVAYQKTVKKRKVHVIYTIHLGERQYIKSHEYESQDTLLTSLFKSYPNSEIVIGNELNGSAFENEKIRLVEIAKNNGYADFNANFIEFRGDSTSNQTDVTTFVYQTLSKKNHTPYRIGGINIYTEHLATNEPYFRKKDTLGDLSFYSKSEKFIVNPNTIAKILPLVKGDLYSRKLEEKATRNLTGLSPYKFITLNTFKNADSDSIYNYNVFLTPHEHKWVFNAGGDVFFSLLNSNTFSNQDLVGLSGNVGYENRNYKNKAIRHVFGTEGTFEFEVPSFRPNTLSLQLNNSFEIPRIIDIFNAGSFLNKIGLLTDRSYKNVNLNGSTKLDLSMGVTSILRFYDLNTINASWSYTFQPDLYARYTLKQIGINVLNTKIKPEFEPILAENPLLAQSFKPYLMTGFLFRELNITRRSREAPNGSYWTYLGNFEVSGLENFIINKAVNAVSNYDSRWKIGALDLSEFVRLENEIRFQLPVLRRSSFAARLNAGIVVPFGGKTSDGLDPVVPYIKQYFVGGPNSLRGWQIRELGPGSYDHEPLTKDEPFFQAGNLKLEMNAEYRFDLFYIFEGAIFLDMGNVWTTSNDTGRPGALFTGSFLDQMAVSTGWGLRLDFDYFLFRFDIGYKLRLPYDDPETGRFVLTKSKYNGYVGNINFAINYPF